MMNVDTAPVILPHSLASAFQRLAQFANTTSWDQWAQQRLTPTQRKILVLLARRNDSLSLSAVARELGVTAATACDSVGALEDKRLVRKGRSVTDGRALSLTLTDEGRHSAAKLASLPDPILPAFDSLEDAELETLYRYLIKMIRSLQDKGAVAAARMCVSCKFFEPHNRSTAETPHFCQSVGASFGDSQIRLDCEMFEVSKEPESLWARFVSPPGEPGRHAAADCGASVNTCPDVNPNTAQVEYKAVTSDASGAMVCAAQHPVHEQDLAHSNQDSDHRT